MLNAKLGVNAESSICCPSEWGENSGNIQYNTLPVFNLWSSSYVQIWTQKVKIALTPNLPPSNGESTGHVQMQLRLVRLVEWAEDFHDRPWLTSRASDGFVSVGVVDSTLRDVGGGTVKQAT